MCMVIEEWSFNMFAIGKQPTRFAFEKLESGCMPLFEGMHEKILLSMSRAMDPDEADRLVCSEALTPKPKPFIFVAWREIHGKISVGFGYDPSFYQKPSDRPSWFTSLSKR